MALSHDQENDPEYLRARLNTLHEWHERAQQELARIQRLPDHSRSLRHKTENSGIAIPLLQNYDNTILEKEAEIARLTNENTQLKKQIDGRSAEDKEVVNTARLAEERAQILVEEANIRLQGSTNENQHLRAHIAELEADNVTLKEKAQTYIVSESRVKDALSRIAKEKEEAEGRSVEAAAMITKLQQELRLAQSKVEEIAQNHEEGQHAAESQKVQLHLMGKENDDKVQEIERLRNKMVQALKQAADNHTTHLKIVEEKHRTVVENLHEQIRAQEAGALKLRAQLSRVQVGNQSSVATPSAVVDTHARSVQEQELKRLYAEVTTLQLQRDDAIFRSEQQQNQHRNEVDQTVRDLRRDLEQSRNRVRELDDRNTKLEGEVAAMRETVRRTRADRNAAVQSASEAEATAEEQLRRIRELNSSLTQLQEAAGKAEEEKRVALDAEKATIRQLERRLEDQRREEAVEKERARTAAADQEKQLNDERTAHRETASRVAALTRTLQEKDVEVQTLHTKSDRLTQGLTAHKQQIATLDDRLNTMVLYEQQYRKDIRTLTLQVEQLRMDHQRITRERDRLASEITTIGGLQRRMAAA